MAATRVSNFEQIGQKMRRLERQEKKHTTGSGTKSSRTICPKSDRNLRGPSADVLPNLGKNRIWNLRLITI